jgi:membrane associated rhomboid family serine protease
VFPLRDDNPTLLTPVVTIAIIIANVLVWIYLQGGGVSERVLTSSVCYLGNIPAEITGRIGEDQGSPCIIGGLTWATVLTSMFLHGGWVHLISNMWFLWLFGNNVEDSMGHLRFLAFYIIGGLVAAGTHIFMNADSLIPTVGASGAISAAMGAYLVLYPRARVHTLFILIIFIKIIPIPAWFVLGQYFVLQLLQSSASSGAGGGVAVWAHIGGFVAGALLIKLFENKTLVEARKQHIKLAPYEVNHKGWY